MRVAHAVLLAAILTAGTLGISMCTARGQAHNGHSLEDQRIHDELYATWTRPNEPKLGCCDMEDCYPAIFKNVGGTWFALRHYGNSDDAADWVPIPNERFEHNRTGGTARENPDGRNHVCMRRVGSTDYIFCAMFGTGI